MLLMEYIWLDFVRRYFYCVGHRAFIVWDDATHKAQTNATAVAVKIIGRMTCTLTVDEILLIEMINAIASYA